MLVSLSRFGSSVSSRITRLNFLQDDDIIYLSAIILIAQFVLDSHFFVVLAQFEQSLTTQVLYRPFIRVHQQAILFLFFWYNCSTSSLCLVHRPLFQNRLSSYSSALSLRETILSTIVGFLDLFPTV